MKSRTCLSHATPTLPVACAILVLAGCSNAAQVAPATYPTAGGVSPVARTSETRVDASSLLRVRSPISGEALSGSIIQGSCHHIPYNVKSKFRATGTASGPYPGTFTANGGWLYDDYDSVVYNFHEQFTITSGRHILRGEMSDIGRDFQGGCNFFRGIVNFTMDGHRPPGNATVSISFGSTESYDESLE